MKSVLVLGFYDKGNLGDEMFKETLPFLLPNFDPTFISTDAYLNQTKIHVSDYHAVICGGGDIFNRYFMEHIEKIVDGIPQPVYAVGIGIPYPSMFETNYLRLFDHVFLRETTDLPELTRQIGGRYSHSLPDLGFLKQTPRLRNVNRKKSNKTPVIGVFLAQSMIKNSNYIDQMVILINKGLEYGNVKLIRFNTGGVGHEDDQEIGDLIMNKVSISENNSLIHDPTIYSTDDMINLMSKLDLAICTRFHAHIFCTIAGCPFVSISTTRKVQLFLDEHDLQDLRIGDSNGIKVLDQTWKNRKRISRNLIRVAYKNYYRLQTEQIDGLLQSSDRRLNKSSIVDQEVIYQKCRRLLFQLTGYDSDDGKINNIQISEGSAEKVSTTMCFELTRIPGSKYEWGTVQNIINKPWDMRGMIDWIYKDIRENDSKNLERLDLDYYNQHGVSGIHRAGWKFVLTYLKILQSPKGILCDTYMDRTFCWGSWALKRAGIIPYTSMWIGFLHHTPHHLHSDNNAKQLVQSKEFIQSLPTCQGLFCLSEYLSNWLRGELNKLEFNIPVVTVYHPTLFVNQLWSPNRINWTQFRLLQIGAWYRNPFTIYSLVLPDYVQKAALQGPLMDDYFPQEDFDPNDINSDPQDNKWEYYLSQYLLDHPCSSDEIISMKNSVQVIDKVSNSEYDDLLQSSVIFLDLVDLSAANTIIECIVRQTPVILNRHPAAVEYLGEKYPLFYDNPDQIVDLLTKDQIMSGYRYLQSKDKKFLQIDHFLSSLIESKPYQAIRN